MFQGGYGSGSNEGLKTEECSIDCSRDKLGRFISCTERGEIVTCDCEGNKLTVGGSKTCT